MSLFDVSIFIFILIFHNEFMIRVIRIDLNNSKF